MEHQKLNKSQLQNELNIFPDELAIVSDKQSRPPKNYRCEMTEMDTRLLRDDADIYQRNESQLQVDIYSNSNNNSQQDTHFYLHQHRDIISPFPLCEIQNFQHFPYRPDSVSRRGENNSLPTNYTSCMTDPGDLPQEDENLFRMKPSVWGQQAMGEFAQLVLPSDANNLLHNVSHSLAIAPHPSVKLNDIDKGM